MGSGVRSIGDLSPRMQAWASRPMLFDGGVAVALFAFGVWNAGLNASLGVELGPDANPPTGWLRVALVGLATLPLALRRRHTEASVLLVTLGFCAVRWTKVPETFSVDIALFTAIYTAGALLPTGRRGWVRGMAILLPALMLGRSLAQLERQGLPDDVETSLLTVASFTLVLNLLFFLAASYGGDLARKRRERERLLEQRTQELARERERGERQAVVAERLRIARELHDVVAHHVSVMGVQAGAARTVLDREPQLAKDALASVEDSSREAVVELQRLLGFLRSPDGDRGRWADRDDVTVDVPQPTLDRLDDLLAELAAVGLRVTVEHAGEGAVPPGTSLTAYRIVQEALTNVLKHGGPDVQAEVRLRTEPDGLHLLVDDDGRGPAVDGAAAAPGTGNGLRGMRERTALHGGWLQAGARPGGGFRLVAWLPSRPDASRHPHGTGGRPPGGAKGTAVVDWTRQHGRVT